MQLTIEEAQVKGLLYNNIMPTPEMRLEKRALSIPWIDYYKENNWFGQKEIAGPEHNPKIADITHSKTDEEPWCGYWAAHMLRETGFAVPKLSQRASSWKRYGVHLDEPIKGCGCYIDTGVGSGHVAFFVGYDKQGQLLLLGGNQGNEVCVKAFSAEGRHVVFFWPILAKPNNAGPTKVLKSKRVRGALVAGTAGAAGAIDAVSKSASQANEALSTGIFSTLFSADQLVYKLVCLAVIAFAIYVVWTKIHDSEKELEWLD